MWKAHDKKLVNVIRRKMFIKKNYDLSLNVYLLPEYVTVKISENKVIATKNLNVY